MRKIPTLFRRVFQKGKVVGISRDVTPGMEWVLRGDGYATVKMDGAACAIIDGKFYKRYDAKNGKTPPAGAIPCCLPDPVTGHHPHWIPVNFSHPADKWFVAAFRNTFKNSSRPADGTYEAIGYHFRDNPYHMKDDMLEPHGVRIIRDLPRTYDGIRTYLRDHYIEGIVFYKDDQPMCKIKRTDFGFAWNQKEALPHD